MKPTFIFAKAVACSVVCMIMMCLASYSQAQNKTIKLTLKDKVTQTPLEDARATLVDLKDSLILATQATHEDGILHFSIKDAGKYKIVIEKDGYKPETCYSTFSSSNEDSSMYFTLSMDKKNADKKRKSE